MIIVGSLIFVGSALAADVDDALNAAKVIRKAIQEKKYEDVWNTRVSKAFQSKTSKDAFVTNLQLGRQQVGNFVKSTFIDMQSGKAQPGSGFEGDVYTFNYRATYANGTFYERVVIIKDPDGKFRLAGLWAQPLPE
jgi:hypothetical protein